MFVSQEVQVHQETLDLYFEDIILQTLEQTADQQAREEIHKRAQEVNDIAYAMEERWWDFGIPENAFRKKFKPKNIKLSVVFFVSSLNSLQSEEIVSEMVYSFLIPEVEKITIRQRGLRGLHSTLIKLAPDLLWMMTEYSF